MGTFMEAGKIGEFQDGTRKKVMIQGHEILLAMIENKYYAVSNRCSHLGGDLSAGKLDGTIITCPKHGSRFDLRDGKVVRWLKGSGVFSAVGRALKSPRPLDTYNIRAEGDRVMVEI
jgi:3-phenylpropionate/trans-cinnamate dioxygenase ferredoxin subunit